MAAYSLAEVTNEEFSSNVNPMMPPTLKVAPTAVVRLPRYVVSRFPRPRMKVQLGSSTFSDQTPIPTLISYIFPNEESVMRVTAAASVSTGLSSEPSFASLPVFETKTVCVAAGIGNEAPAPVGPAGPVGPGTVEAAPVGPVGPAPPTMSSSIATVPFLSGHAATRVCPAEIPAVLNLSDFVELVSLYTSNFASLNTSGNTPAYTQSEEVPASVRRT